MEPAYNGDQADLICQVGGADCRSVQVPDVGVVRYGILLGTARNGLVLVEVGGPGANALSRTDRKSLGLPNELDGFDVLLVNEPWVGQDVPQACQESLGQFVRSTVENTPTSASVLNACPLKTWTATTYPAALRKVLEHEKRSLAGIVGHSYGALPAATAAAAFPDAWLILSSPIAPAPSSGDTIVNERIASIGVALDRSYAINCAEFNLDCSRSGREVAAQAISSVRSHNVPGRAQPVLPGDVGAAVMASLYGLEQNARWLWTMLSSLPQADADTYRQVGRMADQLLMRYGQGDVSPQLGAFIAGMCSSYSYQQWTLTTAPGPALESFLTHMAHQCQLSKADQADWKAQGQIRRHGSVCIFRNKSDPVTPGGWAERWKRLVPQATLVDLNIDGHASLAMAVEHGQPGQCPILT